MTETVYGVFDDVDNAERAVSALKDHGADGNEVSVIRRSDGRGVPQIENEAAQGLTVTGPGDVAAGAMKGGAAGIALGVLASAVALTIPGIGPILAAGPLATAIGAALATGAAGAIGGGFVGYLVDQGVPDVTATRYHEAVTRGDILVSVRSARLSSADVLLLMQKYGAIDVSRHAVGEPAVDPAEPPIVDRSRDIAERVV
jgi:hypothetical protein